MKIQFYDNIPVRLSGLSENEYSGTHHLSIGWSIILEKQSKSLKSFKIDLSGTDEFLEFEIERDVIDDEGFVVESVNLPYLVDISSYKVIHNLKNSLTGKIFNEKRDEP